MHEARAFWVVDRERGEVRTEALPEPGDGEVLVEALFSGVSRGTEVTVFRGKVPASEYARMRAPHQAGEFPWPVKYGYSSVGRVRSGPPPLVGCNVFCLFPHQSAYVVSAQDVVPLPPSVPARRGVLAANLETAINGVWDAGIRAGDRVTVVGAGVVGLLVAYVASLHPGVKVQVVDVEPAKADAVQALGGMFTDRASAEADNDVVVHASATAAGLETALALAGHEATVLELSWYGDARPAVPLGEAFHAKRLRLQSSQVGGLPARQRARWTHRRRLELAVSLLSDARLDALLTSHGALDDLNEQLRGFAQGAPGLCHAVDYMKQT
jgi:threonine dehydrogenase-like Zn-dependent dehydrogenase